jgi:hypothetical protein
MPSSVVRLVALDHRRVERLLERVAAPGPSRARWRRELTQLISAHQAAEESQVFEALAEAWGADAVVDVRAEAARLAAATERTAAVDVDSADLQPTLESLRRALVEHVHGTEGTLLPLVGDRLERKRLRELGGRYERHRDDVLTASGANRAVPRRLDYSRAELYELARKAGIEGRSAMTREELIDALMELSPPSSPASGAGTTRH